MASFSGIRRLVILQSTEFFFSFLLQRWLNHQIRSTGHEKADVLSCCVKPALVADERAESLDAGCHVAKKIGMTKGEAWYLELSNDRQLHDASDCLFTYLAYVSESVSYLKRRPMHNAF